MAAPISQIVSMVCICIVAFGVVPAAGQEPDAVRPQADFRDIEFQGNETFTPPQLLTELAKKTDLSDPSGKIAVDEAGADCWNAVFWLAITHPDFLKRQSAWP